MAPHLPSVEVTLSIKNLYAFNANEADMKKMWEKEKSSRIRFNKIINENKAKEDNYFED